MDADIRRLERAARAGDPHAIARLHAARQRAGETLCAGDYVRLDGARIGRPEVTGNWRVSVLVVGHPEATLIPVGPDRVPLAETLVGDILASAYDPTPVLTLAHADIRTASVGFDVPLVGTVPLRQRCPRCGEGAYFDCVAPSGAERRVPHKARSTVPALLAPPPPLPVHVSEGRDRPSIVTVKASRNPNADLRITRSDLAVRARPRISPQDSIGSP